MKNYIACFLIILTIQLYAQEIEKPVSRIDKASIGFGIGMDYGIVGMSITTSLHRNVALILGTGYSGIGFAYNGGLKARYVSEENPSRITPFVVCLYGINSVVKITNASEYDKSFRGLTFGFGLDFNFKPRKYGFWSFALMIPKRSDEFNYYIKGFRMENEPPPIGLSLGYKIILH